MQKTAKEVFGSEAQKLIDRAIYAKMPDHVKKILNRAYLEDKPYNDIVLHLEREMRLNGLGAPDETTLVPLISVDPASQEVKKEPNQRGNCFYCGKEGHYKAQCRKLKKYRYYEIETQNGASKTTEPRNRKVTLAGKPTRQKTAGIVQTRQTTPENDDTSSQYPQIK